MIEFIAAPSYLYLVYRAYDGREWVEDKLKEGDVRLRRTFRFRRQDLADPAELGTLQGNDEEIDLPDDPEEPAVVATR